MKLTGSPSGGPFCVYTTHYRRLHIMTFILLAVMFTLCFIILDDNMPDGHA